MSAGKEYCANRKSLKLHLNDCRMFPREENKVPLGSYGNKELAKEAAEKHLNTGQISYCGVCLK